MKIFLGLMFFSLNSFAGGGGFVGNGGEGVDYRGRLYLRDLFSQNLHLQPFIGFQTDPGMTMPELPFDYPKELLARKLADLNQAAPGVGDYVLATMKAYTWSLQDFALTPITDDDPIALPEGATLVQLANRFRGVIRLHRASFERLDDANKTALLVHEAVYSLLFPRRAPDGSFFQSAYAAKEITGCFFNRSFLSKPTEAVFSFLSTLDIPGPLPLDVVRQKAVWNLSYGTYSQGLKWRKLGSATLLISESDRYDTIAAFLNGVCSQVAVLPPKQERWIDSARTLRPVSMLIREYKTADGKMQNQVGFRSMWPVFPVNLSYPFETFEGCRAAFAGILGELAGEAW